MGNFNATKVGLERMASFFTDLPLGIDEKQVVGNKQDFIESLVYMLSIGKSKVRGTKNGGMQSSSSWRSIILTTGEEPIIVSNSQGGINTRVIEIYGAPFGDESEAAKAHKICSEHCGFAGAEFLRKILNNDNEAMLRTKYNEISKLLEQSTNNSTHIHNVALICATDILVSKLVFDDEEKTAIDSALDMGKRILNDLQEQQEDVNDKAYEYIREWAMSNKSQFDNDAKQRYGFLESRTFYILPSVLEEALSKKNYSYRKTIRALGERSLIGSSYYNGKLQYSVVKRFGNGTSRFIEIRFNELEESEPF